MKNLILILWFSLVLFQSCNTERKTNKDYILKMQWKTIEKQNKYNIQIKDSIISIKTEVDSNIYNASGFNKDIDLKIIDLTDSCFIIKPDSTIYTNKIFYEIKNINNYSILFLKINYYRQNPFAPEIVTINDLYFILNTDSDILLKETNNIKNIKNFEIEGFKLGDTINLNLVSYFANYFSEYTLNSNPNITFHLEGNVITSISKRNIPEYNIAELVKKISAKINKFPTEQSYNLYTWEKGSAKISLINTGYDAIARKNNQTTQDSLFSTFTLSCYDPILSTYEKYIYKNDYYYLNLRDRKDKIKKIKNNILNNLELGNYLETIDLATQTLNIDKNYYEGYYYRAIAKYNLGNYNGALDDFKQCLNINPFDINANTRLAILYYEIKDFSNFKLYVNKAISIIPDYSYPHYLLALYLIN